MGRGWMKLEREGERYQILMIERQSHKGKERKREGGDRPNFVQETTFYYGTPAVTQFLQHSLHDQNSFLLAIAWIPKTSSNQNSQFHSAESKLSRWPLCRRFVVFNSPAQSSLNLKLTEPGSSAIYHHFYYDRIRIQQRRS